VCKSQVAKPKRRFINLLAKPKRRKIHCVANLKKKRKRQGMQKYTKMKIVWPIFHFCFSISAALLDQIEFDLLVFDSNNILMLVVVV
jgi:hypothetical protein